MKTFNVRHAETFLWDVIDITLYILEESFGQVPMVQTSFETALIKIKLLHR